MSKPKRIEPTPAEGRIEAVDLLDEIVSTLELIAATLVRIEGLLRGTPSQEPSA